MLYDLWLQGFEDLTSKTCICFLIEISLLFFSCKVICLIVLLDHLHSPLFNDFSNRKYLNVVCLQSLQNSILLVLVKVKDSFNSCLDILCSRLLYFLLMQGLVLVMLAKKIFELYVTSLAIFFCIIIIPEHAAVLLEDRRL